jgi:hypothetical protein
MQKRLIVVLGMFLGGHVPAAAAQVVLAHEHVAPAVTTLRAESTPTVVASVPLAPAQNPTAQDATALEKVSAQVPARLGLSLLAGYEPIRNVGPVSPVEVPVEELVAPVPATPRPATYASASAPFAALSLPLSLTQEPLAQHGRMQSSAGFSPMFALAYERDLSLEPLPPMVQLNALVQTLTKMPIAQTWGGRVQLDVLPGKSRTPGTPSGNGLSLSFHFNRDREVRAGGPVQAWRCVSQIVAAALN